MARQKPSGPEFVKVSLLLPPETNQQVEDLAAHRKVSKSDVFRHLLALGIDAERRGQESSPSVASPLSLPASGHEGPNLTIPLTAQLRAYVDFAARLHGLQPAPFVQQMIGEHIASYIEKIREELEEFRRPASGEQQGP